MKSSLPKLIGVVPFSPLAGSPGAGRRHPSDSLRSAGLRATREAALLAKLGYEGILLENFGDAPFLYGSVPPETIASFAVLAAAVREAVRISVGIRVLGNDPRAALAIAAVTDADFIRVDGIGLHGGELLRDRERLRARIPVLSAAESTMHGADGVVFTGKPEGPRGRFPAGKWIEGVHSLSAVAGMKAAGYGVILGGAIRRSGSADLPLDAKLAREFALAYRKGRR